jgi:uncharacterized protein YndB with AHSA1/START domain
MRRRLYALLFYNPRDGYGHGHGYGHGCPDTERYLQGIINKLQKGREIPWDWDWDWDEGENNVERIQLSPLPTAATKVTQRYSCLPQVSSAQLSLNTPLSYQP